jgi:hypothetical protein
MKDLLKPGRQLDKYLNEDGTLIRKCLTCLHRHSFEVVDHWGEYLCIGGQKGWNSCTEKGTNRNYRFWEPRVDVNNHFTEEDFKL